MTPDGRYEYGTDDLCALHLRINAWQMSLGIRNTKPKKPAILPHVRKARGPDKRRRARRG